MSVLGIIPARGGSRRVKKKNIKMLAGHELIAWTIEEAKKAKSLDYFLVSTEDDEIAEVSRRYGAPVPFKRPDDIAEDVDSSLVLMHSIEWYEEQMKKEVGYVVCLQPTSPFRSASDIDRCVQVAIKTNADTVLSVSQAHQHPMWCFEMGPNQVLSSYMNTKLEGDNLVWQKLPLLFYPNGAVYVTKRNVIMNTGRIYGDKLYGYMMPRERSIDLEEELDFIVASAMIGVFGDVRQDREWLKESWIKS